METQAVNGVRGTKPVGRRDVVYSIVVDRLDAVLLRESARGVSLAFGEDESSQQVAVSLQAYFKRKQSEDKTPLFQCEVEAGGCGADQPRDEGACPFCGFDPDAKAVQDARAAEAAGEKSIPAEEVYAELGIDGEEPPPEMSAEISDPEMILRAAGDDADGKSSAKPKGRLKKALPRGREEQPGEMPPAGASTGLAKVVPAELMVVDDTTPSSQVQTETTLLEAEEKFLSATRATWVAWWFEGRALWEIFSQKLWTLRIDLATKAPKYKTFQQYVSDRYNLTTGYVFKRMDASRAFTEVEAAELGMSNCVLLMQSDEETKQKIEQKIRSGEIRNASGTKAEVSKANKERGTVKTKGSKTGERKTGGGRKKEFVKVAIAEQLGKSTIGMMSASGEGGKPVKITEIPAAVEKWLSKVQPFCTHESLDGEIVITEAVVVKDGKMSLVIHRSRPADEEE